MSDASPAMSHPRRRRKKPGLQGCEAGLAYVEFVLSVGVLILMFIGGVEISRYILIVQKVEKTVDTVADIFTQAVTGSIITADVQQYLSSTQQLMSPYPMGGNGIVILTDVSTPATGNSPATVNWQVCGGGTLAVKSAIGSPGGTAGNLPLAMNAGEEVVIGEMYYDYTPVLGQNIVPSSQLYRVAVFRPRFVQETGLTSSSSTNCP